MFSLPQWAIVPWGPLNSRHSVLPRWTIRWPPAITWTRFRRHHCNDLKFTSKNIYRSSCALSYAPNSDTPPPPLGVGWAITGGEIVQDFRWGFRSGFRLGLFPQKYWTLSPQPRRVSDSMYTQKHSPYSHNLFGGTHMPELLIFGEIRHVDQRKFFWLRKKSEKMSWALYSAFVSFAQKII